MKRALALATALLLAAAAPSARAAKPDPAAAAAAELDAQYASALAVMKHPAVSGVLVTEIAPASPAGSAGLHAGDVIVTFAGQNVHDLNTLRQLVADIIVSGAMEEKTQTIAMVVRRQVPAKSPSAPSENQSLTLQVPRQPLGIRAIEVEAGVPARLNPPPSPRGSITLAWDELRKLQNNGGDLGQHNFFRTQEADGTWLGWQERIADPASDDAFSSKIDISRVSPDSNNKMSVTATESVAFRLRTGDYKSAPAFLLESVDVVAKEGDGAIVTTHALRAGALLRVSVETKFTDRIEGPAKREIPCPTPTLIPAAAPLVAAAMPQQKDAVLAVNLMSAHDFVPRPGYVLATRGLQQLPDDEATVLDKPAEGPKAWRVDLMHCGIVVESYWLSDQRRLLRMDAFSGTTLTSRHVPGETEARVIVIPKSRLPR